MKVYRPKNYKKSKFIINGREIGNFKIDTYYYNSSKELTITASLIRIHRCKSFHSLLDNWNENINCYLYNKNKIFHKSNNIVPISYNSSIDRNDKKSSSFTFETIIL